MQGLKEMKVPVCGVWAHNTNPAGREGPKGGRRSACMLTLQTPRPPVVGELACGVHAAYPRAAFKPQKTH